MAEDCSRCAGSGLVAAGVQVKDGVESTTTGRCPRCDGSGEVRSRPLRDRY